MSLGLQQNATFLVMHSVLSRCTWINSGLTINLYPRHHSWFYLPYVHIFVSIHFSFLFGLTFILISPSSHFTTRGFKRRCDWQACAVSLLDNTPPTSLVARVTDGFSLLKHSVSISVTSDWWESCREEGVGETPSILHFPWQMTEIQDKQCTASVRLCF